ncbi:hypothetical protein CUMW_143770 [Citrus unshiu]|uniref:Ubiquitin-like protease family profile domain-containing protein n=1 Tax=Citrus unshiu TaxID=55188 RepID=A0A2H5PJZ7_CITUN|nr:hypothetical protein CUMW_143770 [Citrus unshiu]
MAKSESSDIEVGMMYFCYANHFSGQISSMCNLSLVVKAIDEKLTKRQLNMFKKDIFGHFLECRSFPFSEVILHNLLLRQVAHEEDSREDQLWFQIGEHLIRLSIVEWCLVTGLSYGVDTELRDNKTMDRLGNTVLNARKNHCQINFDWLNEVDDKQYFRNRPWGLVSWEIVYDSLDNALFEKDEKFKTTRLKNPDHNIEKYNLYGFTSRAWIYEAIGGLPSTWVVKTKNKIPRIVQWKPMASSRINFAEVYSFFNDESRIESNRKYWLTVKDYMPSIPNWVHKHQPSINAMSSVSRQSDEHDEHDDIPNPTPEQRHDTSEDEVVVDDHQEQTDNSDNAHDSEVLLNQLWNNGDCAIDSLVFDHCLNCYLCGRQHTMSKSITDVDMLLIPVNLDGEHWVLARVDFRKNKVWIYESLLTCREDKRYKLKFKPLEVIFPRWLEYVGFYNIRPELRSADPWKVIAVSSVPQQEPETGDCEFNASHVQYFRKKIAVDIFNDDIVL